MNPTIKARIEKIKNGEVPEGYKRTKAGILPLDWRYGLLNEVTEKITTKNRGKNFTKILTNSANEGIVSQTDYFDKQIANTENIEGYYVVKKGYFVYNPRISVAAPCGPINCYHGEETGVMSPLYTVFSFNSQDVNIAYIEYYFASSYWYKYMKSVANYGVRSDRMNITDEDFFLLPIPIPESTEQQKIAEILATQDKVIELKEKLLKEKQRQKKYLMQQLLTGKKRLPGFSGEWETVKLSAIATPIKRKVEDKSYEVLSITAGVGFVNQAEKFGKEIAGEQYKQYTLLLRTEFSYNKGNSKKYPQGCIYPLENREKAAVPNVFISFRLNSSVCWYKFYKSLFESGALNKQLFRVINSGVRNDGLLNINSDDFFNCMLVVPEYDEQTAIAQILSTVDKEIEFLKKDVEQEKLKKKSLMQLLLTGIARVENDRVN